jgi:hypothetical protein
LIRTCHACGGGVEQQHRYCPWCAAPLRLKLVEFFRPHPDIDDHVSALRVSRYLGGGDDRRHTRISIWTHDDRAAAAISLDDDETRRLSSFLSEIPPAAPRPATRVRGWLARRSG